MTRTCPECSAKMCTEVIHGVQLDICPECAGIWFDFEELRTLLAQDPLVMSELEDRTMPHGAHKPIGTSLRHCPDCHLPLQQYRYLYTSPIVLEACTDCGGFFVEDGQLGKMQQWLDQSHKPMTAKEGASFLLAEATIAHDNEMRRQENLRYFFSGLQRYQPWWTSLVP